MALYLQSRLLVFPSDDAALVRAYGNADFQCLFRKNALDILRPFDEAQAAAVNVVVEAYVESLFRAGDSVEVEVEYRISVRSLVFIDNGKVGELTASSFTPSLWQRAVVNVVLPAPIGA